MSIVSLATNDENNVTEVVFNVMQMNCLLFGTTVNAFVFLQLLALL